MAKRLLPDIRKDVTNHEAEEDKRTNNKQKVCVRYD